jgi:pro-sigmaK processing inhibitor BofA
MDILGFLAGVVIILAVCKILSKPFKLAMKLIINSIVGLLTIYALNLVLGYFALPLIALNALTCLLVGIFGVPVMIILLIISVLL